MYAKKWILGVSNTEFFGRTISGLPMLSNSFTISPPYFDFSDLEDGKRETTKYELDDWILQRATNISTVNEEIFYLVKMCIA